MLGPQRPDEEHADRIRKCAEELETAVREATADGLTVRLDPAVGNGMQRGRDRTTTFPTVHALIWRPL